MKQTVKDLKTGDKIELDYLLELICSIKETSIEHDNAVYSSFEGGYPSVCEIDYIYQNGEDVEFGLKDSDYVFCLPATVEINISAHTVKAKDLAVGNVINVFYLFDLVGMHNDLNDEQSSEMYSSFFGGFPDYDHVSSVHVYDDNVQFYTRESDYVFSLPLNCDVRVQ